MKSKRNQSQASTDCLPVESHRTDFPEQGAVVTSGVNCCVPGKLIEVQCPWFLLEVDHIGTFCLAYTTISDSQRKANVQNNPQHLYQHLSHSQSLLSVLRMVRTFRNSSPQKPAKDQPYKQAYERKEAKLVKNLFCTTVKYIF